MLLNLAYIISIIIAIRCVKKYWKISFAHAQVVEIMLFIYLPYFRGICNLYSDDEDNARIFNFESTRIIKGDEWKIRERQSLKGRRQFDQILHEHNSLSA